MTQLGNGLADAENCDDALSPEAELSGGAAHQHQASILAVQTNIAVTYGQLGRDEEALSMKQWFTLDI